MIKLSDYVIKFIEELGVKNVFYIPGGVSMHLNDSLGKSDKIEPICCLHEQACGFAAEAYGEYTKNIGVAMVTAGPASTNCITPVATAWMETRSMLVLSGQAKTTDLLHNRGVRSMGQQEVDIVSMVKSITKYAVTVMNPNAIRYHLEKAVYLAKEGRRGPVWIDIPLDIQAAQIDEETLLGFDSPLNSQKKSSKLLKENVEKVLELIKNSERPVMFVGSGVQSANAQVIFNKLIEKLQIPVLVAWKGADLIDENNPYHCGRPGGIGQRGANFTQQNADCIIIVGARLDLTSLAFSHKNFARNAKKVLVDVDAPEILKMETKIDVPILADAKDFLNELYLLVSKNENKDFSSWLNKAKEWHKKYPVVLDEYYKQKSPYISCYAFMDILSDILSPKEVIIPESAGTTPDIMMQAFKVKYGQRIFNSPGIGVMGSGIPNAIGTCLAHNRKRTICVTGDGSFQMNIQELETLKRLKLPIKFFYINNNGYRSIVDSQRNHFKRLVGANPDSGLTFPDIQKIAKAYGLKFARISHVSESADIIKKVLNMSGPVICEVMVPPNEHTLPRVMARVKEDGTIVSSPMEDMTPLLTRAELKKEMLIPLLKESL